MPTVLRGQTPFALRERVWDTAVEWLVIQEFISYVIQSDNGDSICESITCDLAALHS